MITKLKFFTRLLSIKMLSKPVQSFQKVAGPVLMKSITSMSIIMLTFVSQAQEKKLDYHVIRNGKRIGDLSVMEIRSGEKISLKLQSEINTRVLFKIAAKGNEESQFDKGTLITSSFTQSINGKEKVNKQTSHKGTHYLVNNQGKQSRINRASIAYNMICLYTIEPRTTALVYSDKYSSFLTIIKLKDQHYQINFPDGNYNEYIYENGICKSIKVESSLYSITMELKK